MATSISLERLSNIDEIRLAFDQLCADEESVTDELETLFKQRSELEDRILSLRKTLPNLQLVQDDADQLVSMVQFASQLAENVSCKVRQLDLAKSRVSDCLQRVEDIMDVKFCTDGVQSALQNEDYEQAAAHIHRYLSLDENVLKSTVQNTTEGSTLDTSFGVLHEAERKLKNIVTRKFDEAVRDEDLASVERFFKIFPLLNQYDEGLKKFSLYLCSQIAETSQKNLKEALSSKPSDKRANVIFADTITLLFEGIARILEIQQPLIETYYGPGKLPIIVEVLQKECDRQSKKIIEEFKKSRQFVSKVHHVGVLTSAAARVHESRLDPREMDILLGETALINSRSELYVRFLRRRMINDVEVAHQDLVVKQERLQSAEKLIKDCELSHSTQELLGNYILMEEYFLRESVTKAINMDSLESESLTSSSVDDIFFIVKKCIRRALSSSSVDGVCATINNACTILDSVFLEAIRSKVNLGLSSGMLDLSQAYNVFQGKQQAVNPEKAKLNYLVALNNLQAASEYTASLKKSIEEEMTTHFTSITKQEKFKLDSCVSELMTVAGRFGQVLELGMREVVSSILRPRIRPWVDAFMAVSREINEEEFDNYEVNDPFVQNLIVSIDGLLTSLKDKLSDGNYDKLVTSLTAEVVVQLEKVVLKSSFNRLGGLQFDKELRSLVGYLAGATTWSVRDKFARLTQIATILNLDKVSEILDYWGSNSGPIAWRLTPSEVRQVLSLRVDFGQDEIRRIKL